MTKTLSSVDFTANSSGSNNGIDRVTNTVRRRAVFPPDLDDLTVDGNGRAMHLEENAKASYKAKLIGASIESNQLVKMDKDFELKDRDVVMEFIDGIPSLTFFDRVSQFIDRKRSLTVIVKLLRRRIGFNALYNRVSTSWNLKNRFQLMDLENGFFLLLFQNKDDLDRVIFWGPWAIFRHYLFVRPRASTFSINNDGQLELGGYGSLWPVDAGGTPAAGARP
ncbi:hypothetical protein Gogos_009018 [Gossypium gossypioides]|uniref:DUF4283 domain-containing protein n=1 Tax=Gossypium gossypioides TaxID=34282 RepID=A0A7J9CDP5_GOSGO|nr:hypothetical protein [Gossypium gossypioides]